MSPSGCTIYRPEYNMISPTFFFVLLLLGHTQAATIASRAEEPQPTPFTIIIDPGFKVTAVKLSEVLLGECGKEQAKTTTACYTQTEKSTVHFIIKNKSAYKEVQFMVGDTAQATYTINENGELAPKLPKSPATLPQNDKVPDGAIEEKNFKLTFVPDAMKLIPKESGGAGPAPPSGNGGAGQAPPSQDSDGAKSIRTKNTPQPETVTNKCSATKRAVENCFEVVKAEYPVTVTADMASKPQVLTLEGADNKKVQTTIYQGSGAAWTSISAALILANLAIVCLFQ